MIDLHGTAIVYDPSRRYLGRQLVNAFGVVPEGSAK